nr:immunoglobulin heavy chain junction region [Macaca mulatta]
CARWNHGIFDIW